MRRQERIHEGFEVRAVPLGQGVEDIPVAVVFLREGAGGCEAFVQAVLEAFDLVDIVGNVIARADWLAQAVVL